MYRCGGGAGLASCSPFVPFVLGNAPGVCAAAGLEGVGDDVNSLSMSMGCGVGWSLMADMADVESLLNSSGGRFSGCESRSYLEERLEE